MSRSKVMGLEDAVGLIRDGDTVATSGSMLQGEPTAAIREMVRQRKKDLFFVPVASTSLGGELLIGNGCISRMALTAVGFMRYGAVGPRFRIAAQAGKIEFFETEQSQKLSALRAASRGLPFMPNIVGVGTDFPKINPMVKVLESPFNPEEKVLAIKAIEPDVMIVSTAVSDEEGNAQHGGIISYDALGARAAKKVIVVTEEIVRPEYIKSNPHRTTVLAYNVCAVVHLPYGSHPSSNHGCYRYDPDHVKEYIAEGRSDEGFRSYNEKYVVGPKDHFEYLELIGLRRLFGLRARR